MSSDGLTLGEMNAWQAYLAAHSGLDQALERDLAEHGVVLGDYHVLRFLSEAEDQKLRMCDLADLLKLSPSGLTRRLDGLVANGFVTREPSEHDRRAMLAVLTTEGHALMASTAPHHIRSVRRRIFDRLSDEQVEALESIFTTISAGLHEPADANAFV